MKIDKDNYTNLLKINLINLLEINSLISHPSKIIIIITIKISITWINNQIWITTKMLKMMIIIDSSNYFFNNNNLIIKDNKCMKRKEDKIDKMQLKDVAVIKYYVVYA